MLSLKLFNKRFFYKSAWKLEIELCLAYFYSVNVIGSKQVHIKIIYLPHAAEQRSDWPAANAVGCHIKFSPWSQLYKNISMLFLFPVKDGKLSTGVNATFDASCYG